MNRFAWLLFTLVLIVLAGCCSRSSAPTLLRRKGAVPAAGVALTLPRSAWHPSPIEREEG